jgi:hypothetical protein
VTLVDGELGALRLTRVYRLQVSEGLLRQWANRYPDTLPRRGLRGRRVQYAVEDLDAIAEKMLGAPPSNP